MPLSPSEQQELDALEFARLSAERNAAQSAKPTPFVPEMVAGSPEQMQAQRARNLQGQLGLKEPVSPTDTLNFGQRYMMAAAPTPAERKTYADTLTPEQINAHYAVEYGQGGFIPISKDRALVKVAGKDGKAQWVIDDPKGWDMGDVASIAARAPEIVSGIVGGARKLPIGQSMPAVAASATASVAANVVGALQDIGWRAFVNRNAPAATPDEVYGAEAGLGTLPGGIGIAAQLAAKFAPETFASGVTQVQRMNPSEIFQRRIPAMALETFAGAALPKVIDHVINVARKIKAEKAFVKPFIEAGEKAESRLKASGINPTTVAEVADNIRALNPSKLNAEQAGKEIADHLTNLDQTAVAESTQSMRGAAGNLESRIQGDLASPTGITGRLEPDVVGNAVIGGVTKTFEAGKAAAGQLYDDALATISQAAKDQGVGQAFVTLNKTKSLLKEIFDKELAKTSSGASAEAIAAGEAGATRPADFYASLLSTIKQIDKTTDIPQTLTAIRAMRTRVGDVMSGKLDQMFPGMDTKQAKRLYGALTDDIDASVNAVTGPGADALRAANAAWKKLVDPVHESDFLAKLVNNEFKNPEEIISRLSQGKSGDWQVAKEFIPPNTYNHVRRGVLDNLVGGTKVSVAGQDLTDLTKLSGFIDNTDIPMSVKTEIFGSKALIDALSKKAKEAAFIQSKQGLFTAPRHPTMDALNAAITTAKTEGFDATNKQLADAIAITAKRRETIAQSLASQIRSGNLETAAENLPLMLDTLYLGTHSPSYVKGVHNSMPPTMQREVGDALFQHLWDKARSATQSMVDRSKNAYDNEAMLRNVFGSKDHAEIIEHAVGPQKFQQLEDWVTYMAKLALKNKGGQGGRDVTGLIAVAPYHNLFAARATALALQSASGRALAASATPNSIELFSQARLMMNHPEKTGAGIALVQRAMNTAGYGDYLDMMSNLTPEQQKAVDDYLTK